MKFSLTLNQRIITLLIAYLIGIGLLAVIFVKTHKELGSRAYEVGRISLPAVRSMTYADMMHDGLRAVVYRSIFAVEQKDIQSQKEVQGELQDFIKLFEQELNKLDSLPIDPEIRKELTLARPKVDAYVDMSSEMVNFALNKNTKLFNAKLSEFQASFEDLEGNLARLGEMIENNADKSVAQSEKESKESFIYFWVAFGLIFVLVTAMGIFIGKSIIKPISNIAHFLKTVAEGDLTTDLKLTGRDEISLMGQSVNLVLLNLRNSFATLSSNSKALTQASSTLSSLSQNLGANANQTSLQVSSSASSADAVSMNTRAVAAAAEEMTATIQEITKSTQEAAAVAVEAVNAAKETNRVVEQLGRSSVEIGDVVKVITGIADQTNLLALNATIEAARAGESGKGFAVVASAVKDLARQTAAATENISKRITMIQSDTADAVTNIATIAQVIGKINSLQSFVTSSVKEQGTVIGDISRNINQAATGTSEIAKSIEQVSTSAELTNNGAQEAMSSAKSLKLMAEELNTILSKFKF